MAGKKKQMVINSLKENILTMATFLGVLIGELQFAMRLHTITPIFDI